MIKLISRMAAILSIFLCLLLQDTFAIEGKRVYIVASNGEYIVVDAVSDKILKMGKLTSKNGKLQHIYRIHSYDAGKVLVAIAEYGLFAFGLDTLILKKELDIDTQYEHVDILVNLKDKLAYIIWLPYNNISEYTIGGRMITLLNQDLQTKNIAASSLPDSIRGIDFSADGSQLNIVYFDTKDKLQIYDINEKKIIKDVSIDEIALKAAYNAAFEDIIGDRILITDFERKDEHAFRRYVYDISRNTYSKSIKININAECRLLDGNAQIVCDEFIIEKDRMIKLGVLHFYDINQRKEIARIDLLAREAEGSIIGISPDRSRLYYASKKSVNIIDLKSFKLVKMLDVSSKFEYAAFFGY